LRSSQLTFVLIALIVFGVVGVVAKLVTATGETEELALSGITPLTKNVVDRVVIRSIKYGTTTDLRLVEDKWMADAYPTVDVWFELLWVTTARFEGADLVSTNPDNHPLMGVDTETGTEVQFWDGDQLIEQFIIGDRWEPPPADNPEARVTSPWSPRAQRCYFRYQDQDEVYSVYCPIPNRFVPDINLWANPIIMEMPLEDLAGFAYIYPDEKFQLMMVERRWAVVVDGEAHQIVPSVMEELIKSVPRVVTSVIPTVEEVAQLNFGHPDATIFIETFDEAKTDAVQLLFLKKEDAGYYVKNAAKPYVYFLDGKAASRLLRTRTELSPGSYGIPSTTTSSG